MNLQTAADNLRQLLEECRRERLLGADEPAVTALQGDASDRKFFRIRQGTRCYIALLSPRKNLDGIDENDSYFHIGRHLRTRQLPAPHILWSDLDRGCFLLQDLGDCHLQTQVAMGRTSPQHAYRLAVKLLVRVHRLAPEGFQPHFCFDSVGYNPEFVYARELQYFRNAFLNGYLQLDVAEEELQRDFQDLAEAAGCDGRSLVMHRDFQSRNLMVWQNRLWVLDFQGMRFGPPAYDLASLLIDPYVALSRRLQEQMCRYYWTGAAGFLGGSYEQFLSTYQAVKLCRNLQVLAAYAFLAKVKGKTQFLQYIPPAWRLLDEWSHSRHSRRYPKLQRMVCAIRGRKKAPWQLRQRADALCNFFVTSGG